MDARSNRLQHGGENQDPVPQTPQSELSVDDQSLVGGNSTCNTQSINSSLSTQNQQPNVSVTSTDLIQSSHTSQNFQTPVIPLTRTVAGPLSTEELRMVLGDDDSFSVQSDDTTEEIQAIRSHQHSQWSPYEHSVIRQQAKNRAYNNVARAMLGTPTRTELAIPPRANKSILIHPSQSSGYFTPSEIPHPSVALSDLRQASIGITQTPLSQPINQLQLPTSITSQQQSSNLPGITQPSIDQPINQPQLPVIPSNHQQSNTRQRTIQSQTTTLNNQTASVPPTRQSNSMNQITQSGTPPPAYSYHDPNRRKESNKQTDQSRRRRDSRSPDNYAYHRSRDQRSQSNHRGGQHSRRSPRRKSPRRSRSPGARHARSSPPRSSQRLTSSARPRTNDPWSPVLASSQPSTLSTAQVPAKNNALVPQPLTGNRNQNQRPSNYQWSPSPSQPSTPFASNQTSNAQVSQPNNSLQNNLSQPSANAPSHVIAAQSNNVPQGSSVQHPANAPSQTPAAPTYNTSYNNISQHSVNVPQQFPAIQSNNASFNSSSQHLANTPSQLLATPLNNAPCGNATQYPDHASTQPLIAQRENASHGNSFQHPFSQQGQHLVNQLGLLQPTSQVLLPFTPSQIPQSPMNIQNLNVSMTGAGDAKHDWKTKFYYKDNPQSFPVTSLASAVASISKNSDVGVFKIGDDPVILIERVIDHANNFSFVPFEYAGPLLRAVLPREITSTLAALNIQTFSDLADLLVTRYYVPDSEFTAEELFQQEFMKDGETMHGYYARLLNSASKLEHSHRYVQQRWFRTIPQEIRRRVPWNADRSKFNVTLNEAEAFLMEMKHMQLTYAPETCYCSQRRKKPIPTVSIIEDEEDTFEEEYEPDDDQVETDMIMLIQVGPVARDSATRVVEPVPPSERPSPCSFCGMPNHQLNDCRMKARKCPKCYQLGHPSYWCPAQRDSHEKPSVLFRRRPFGGRGNNGNKGNRKFNSNSSKSNDNRKYTAGNQQLNSQTAANNSNSYRHNSTAPNNDDHVNILEATEKEHSATIEEAPIMVSNLTPLSNMYQDPSTSATHGYFKVKLNDYLDPYGSSSASSDTHHNSGPTKVPHSEVWLMEDEEINSTANLKTPSKFAFKITVGGIETSALLDSGATISCISADLVPLDAVSKSMSGHLLTAGEGRHAITAQASVTFQVNGSCLTHEMRVVPTFRDKFILGSDFLIKERVSYDYQQQQVIAKFNNSGLSVKLGSNDKPKQFNQSPSVVATVNDVIIPPGSTQWVLCFREEIEPNTSEAIVEAYIPEKKILPRNAFQLQKDCIVPATRMFKLPITNCSLGIAHLTAGEIVGKLSPITQEQVFIITHEIQTISASTTIPSTDVSEPQSIIQGELSRPIRHKWAMLSDHLFAKLQRLLTQYDDVFYEKGRPVKPTNVIKHTIELLPGVRTVYSKSRPIPEAEVDEVRRHMQELAKQGYIVPSTSDFNSPLVLVRKSNGELRICNDYRPLNEVTVTDRYEPRRADRILSGLAGRVIFSVLDLKSGFYQIEIDELSRQATAFSLPQGGHWQYVRMPFGLKNAPATFCKAIDQVLRKIEYLRDPTDKATVSILAAYVDDVIVASDNEESHYEHLELLFQAFRKANLTFNPTKCQFLEHHVKFLGHIVSHNGKQPDPEKVKAITNWPTPTTAKAVKSFLGIVGYYRDFIPNISKITEPLRIVSNSQDDFKIIGWNDAQDTAFISLKQALSSSPILAFSTPQGEFIVDTDASTHGLGCCLKQIQNNKEVTIAFGSRALTRTEANYTPTEIECLGLYYALRHFHIYIHMRKVLVRTDHRALSFLMNKRDSPNHRLRSWYLLISVYCPSIQYVPGKTIPHVDALSRQYEDTVRDPQDILGEQIELSLPTTTKSTYTSHQDISQDIVYAIDYSSQTWQDQLIAHQQSDPECASAMKIGLELRDKNNNLKYAVHDKLLMMYDNGYKPLVPFSLRNKIIESFHGALVAGHRGEYATIERLRAEYTWPGLSRDVKDYIHNCEACTTYKMVPKQLIKAKLSTRFDMISPAFSRIEIDVKGPLKETSRGNEFFVTFIDLATRWVEAFATPSVTAEAVANLFVEGVICRHGIPEMVYSDQGSNFKSKEFQMFVARGLGAQQIFNTAYTPKSSGTVERVHRTLGTYLDMYQGLLPESEWDRLLPFALAAYRSAYHTAIGCSPFEALYGRIFKTYEPSSSQRLADLEDLPIGWIAETATRIASIKEVAIQRQLKNRSLGHQDQVNPVPPGDDVWVKNQGSRKKVGLYQSSKEVVSVTPHTVTIREPSTNQPNRTKTVHLDNIKYSGNKNNAILRQRNAEDSKLQDSKPQDSKLQDSNHQDSKLQDSKLQDSELQDSEPQGSKLLDSKLQDSKLQDSKLQDSEPQGSKLQDSKLQDSKHQNSNLQDSKLQDSEPQDSEFQGSKSQDSKHQSTQTSERQMKQDRDSESSTLDERSNEEADIPMRDHEKEKGLY